MMVECIERNFGICFIALGSGGDLAVKDQFPGITRPSTSVVDVSLLTANP